MTTSWPKVTRRPTIRVTQADPRSDRIAIDPRPETLPEIRRNLSRRQASQGPVDGFERVHSLAQCGFGVDTTRQIGLLAGREFSVAERRKRFIQAGIAFLGHVFLFSFLSGINIAHLFDSDSRAPGIRSARVARPLWTRLFTDFCVVSRASAISA